MIKHIGRHGEKKLVVVFRQLLDAQAHMALVVMTETLPTAYHNELMTLIQSDRGQATNNLADVLGDTNFADGTNILNTFNSKGWLKKVPTKQVILTPTNNPASHVRLDEINNITNKLEVGGEGAQEMANLDAQRGLYDPANDRNIVDVKQFEKNLTDDNIPVTDTGVMDDTKIAQVQIQQAESMEAQVKALTEEAARLKAEAYEMAPALKPKRAYKQRMTKAEKEAAPANVES